MSAQGNPNYTSTMVFNPSSIVDPEFGNYFAATVGAAALVGDSLQK
jgi:hypothetical protein